MQEWYFIVATYNPHQDELKSHAEEESMNGLCSPNCLQDPNYWNWNIQDGEYTPRSMLGNKCKVEIISKTDLLRARGYNT